MTPFSRSLIAIVASLFEETYITKPRTSRPTNSEVYLVGKGFKGISSELARALLDRCEAYKTLDKLPSTWGSLLQPDVLARADADILEAAQEVHGEQQVAFLNEISDAYRVSDGDKSKIPNTYENEAQRTWLDENPMLVIETNENLNNAVIEDAAIYIAQAQQDQAQQTQAQSMPMQAQQDQAQAQQDQAEQDQAQQDQALGDDSILIPEEESEPEPEEKDGGGEKRTIKFNLN